MHCWEDENLASVAGIENLFWGRLRYEHINATSFTSVSILKLLPPFLFL
jgi:hypothetical protein